MFTKKCRGKRVNIDGAKLSAKNIAISTRMNPLTSEWLSVNQESVFREDGPRNAHVVSDENCTQEARREEAPATRRRGDDHVGSKKKIDRDAKTSHQESKDIEDNGDDEWYIYVPAQRRLDAKKKEREMKEQNKTKEEKHESIQGSRIFGGVNEDVKFEGPHDVVDSHDHRDTEEIPPQSKRKASHCIFEVKKRRNEFDEGSVKRSKTKRVTTSDKLNVRITENDSDSDFQ